MSAKDGLDIRTGWVNMNFEAELKKLRTLYIEATPNQRLRVIQDRLKNLHQGPNLLVVYVSALEGFARCITMHQHGSSKEELTAIYPRYRNMGLEELVTKYLQTKKELAPSSFFGPETWEMVKYSISFRNLLVHECTYLGQNKYPQLIHACEQALGLLAKLEGLNFERPGQPELV
ncbi:MAG: hypothetical protein PHF56_04220 [Desulfuromonadaceae bacterium]|nr:hypothetical protein [Desulfuromonadaceae bacterium]